VQLDGPASPVRNSPPRNRSRQRAGAAQRSALATSPYLEIARRDRRERDALANRVEALERKLARESHRRRRAEERVHILTGIENELTDAESADKERDGSSSGEDDGVDGGGFSISVRVGSPLAARRPGSRGERRSRSRSGGSRSGSSKQDDGGSHLPAIGMARVSSSSSSASSR
jgi:hypothetical protein